jgi:carboxynorspermidine decarboxylase
MSLNFAIDQLPTPYYIVDEQLLLQNLHILRDVMDKSDCKILLAQKAFAMFELYPLIGQYLSGATASGLFEAKLGREKMGKENHIFCPAYTEKEFPEITALCDHIIFNSFHQWGRFQEQALAAGCSCGLRINPQCSTQDQAIYDPCAPGSRLGVSKENFRPDLLEGLSGLHFHTLCEQNADALLKTVAAVERDFGPYLQQMHWLNLGGGHHITRSDYDVEALVDCIGRLQQKYDLQIYLEPGEAVVLNTGFLVASVLEIVKNEIETAILDTSAACHMPDVLEMPYRPPLLGAGLPQQKSYTYRLGGPTCLAGDIIGDYSFEQPLQAGDRLVFGDMAHYSMVKNNMFNGLNLPSIAIADRKGQVRLIRSFGYEDYKNRLS